MHLLALKRPTGYLRDLRFLLCSSVSHVALAHPYRHHEVGPQPLDGYRLLMAEHRISSTASKPRRASRAKGSRKPSAPRAPRSKSSKAKTAAS